MARRRDARWWLNLIGVVLLGSQIGCDNAPNSASENSAPVEAAAAWVIEPPRLEIGDVATLTLVVSTRRGEHALPYVPPELSAFDVISLQSFAPEARAGRDVQRTEMRVRPRTLGSNEWPESELTLVSSTGERRTLAVPGRTIEIVTHLEGEGAQRRPEPPRLRGAAAPEADRISTVVAFSAGLAVGSLAFAMLGAVRRRRAKQTVAAVATARDPAARAPLASTAEDPLLAARASRLDDPQRAAALLSDLLRDYLAARYRIAMRVRTSPELASGPTPFAARSRWEGFISLLTRLDALRFAPPEHARANAAELDSLFGEIETIVQERFGSARKSP